MADLETRIRAKAEELWRENDCPAGGPEAFRDRASELIAIQDNTGDTLKPNPEGESARPEDAEPLEAVENLGDLPNLTDQGEIRDFPLRPGERTDQPAPASSTTKERQP